MGHAGIDHAFIRELLKRGDAVAPDFAQFVKDPDPDLRYDLELDLIMIARAIHSPGMIPFLAECARAGKFDISDELLEAFVELGGDAKGALLALYEESDGSPEVAFALAALGVKDDRILAILTERLKDEPVDAAIDLGVYGDPAAEPALTRAMESEQDPSDRLMIEEAIRKIGEERPPAPPPDIWKEYKETDLPAFAAFDETELLRFLKSPVAEYRERAVRTLALDELNPLVAGKVIELANSDPDLRVRASAWESLEGVSEPKGIAAAVRAKALDETAPMEDRAGAIVAVAGDERDNASIQSLIVELWQSPETRAQSVKAMWHSADRRYEKYVPQALDDPDKEVAKQGITAAGLFGMVSLVGRIEAFFEDEHLRNAALYGYALASPTDVTPARLRKLFTKIEDLANGLSEEEAAIVAKALDDRLEAYGYPAMFLEEQVADGDYEPGPDEGDLLPTHEHRVPASAPASKVRAGRNDPCPCGSGKKYKKCCGA